MTLVGARKCQGLFHLVPRGLIRLDIPLTQTGLEFTFPASQLSKILDLPMMGFEL